MKNLLLLLVLSCTLLASTHALYQAKERLKGRVIHFESLLKRGRFLMQNDHKDSDGKSSYLFVDEKPKNEIYFDPKVQFKAVDCGGVFLCFESLSLQNHYLAAGFPVGNTKKRTVKLTYSSHPQGEKDNKFLWKVFCTNNKLDKCYLYTPKQFTAFDSNYLITDNWGREDGKKGTGHYDATLSNDVDLAYFKIHAEDPTDSYVEIFNTVNSGSTEQKAKYTATVGVSTTDSKTHTIGTSTSIEIGAAFEVYSASVSTTIDKSWEHTSSSTFEQSKEVSHELKLPPGKKVVLKQLIGKYAGMFKVGADKYVIEETKVTKRSYFFHPRARPQLTDWFNE